MTRSATIRVMSAEEIAAQAGGETPFLHAPDRATMFAEREMRLRQLAPGHAMGDFLRFMAELAQVQQERLKAHPSVPLPDAAALDQAAKAGLPPVPASDWPRDPAWRDGLHQMLRALRPRAPETTQAVIDRLLAADEDFLERQADGLLHGVMLGLDMAAAPLIAAALQVYWTHLLLAVQAAHQGGGQPFGRIDDGSACPCCGSKPTASVIRVGGSTTGQRYLHCSLCSLQWHRVRIQCTHCGGEKHITYQSLQATGEDEEAAGERAAKAVVQAETCDDCHHYLKLVHAERDAMAEPIADDLATITLDLLVSEGGWQRHGVNLMLLFGEPPPEPGAA